ncbi:MAG TPA: hypothetical protein VLG40_05065 [Candidatus Saccharimonas sp.]|nr:hypothetical protein [Candidatus Saccharimonas sp.]
MRNFTQEVVRLLAQTIGYFFDASKDLAIVETNEHAPKLEPLLRWYNRSITAYQAVRILGRPDAFAQALTTFIEQEVSKIKAKKRYDDLRYLMLYCVQIQTQVSRDAGALCKLIVGCIFACLGDESHMLVGVRDNTLVFKEIPVVGPQELAVYLEHLPFLTYGAMEYVGADDTWLVPDFRKGNLRRFAELVSEDAMNACADLIEKAFYGQRYIVNPHGVEVKIFDHPIITSVSLKVRAAQQQGALVDILALVGTTEGQVFTIVTEDRLIEGHGKGPGPTMSMGDEITLVVCQVYHDLVTAIAVPSPKTARQARTGTGIPKMPLAGTKYRYTVLPRRLRSGKPASVRTKIANPVITEPRRVSGYPKRGRMTQRHRQALEAFEKEYGVHILRFLNPEEETYIRPHFSPAVNAAEIQTLPRFARHQMECAVQTSIKRLRDRQE